MEVVSCYKFRPDSLNVIIIQHSGAKMITVLIMFYRLPLKGKTMEQYGEDSEKTKAFYA
jgi:hypothetical protein